MSKPKIIPTFRNEAEEIEFWDTHDPREYMTEIVDDVIWDIRPQRKQRINLRIEPSLVVDLRELAREHDTRYQTLARGLVRRGVRELEEVQ
jgi:predicted DNA binding CopG/RHH family protein